MQKEPKKLTFESMFNTFSANNVGTKNFYFGKEGLAMALGLNKAFHVLMAENTPFLLQDYRMGIVVNGELHCILNLIEHHFTKGTIIILTPGSIAQPIEISEDFDVEGMGLSTELFHLAHNNQLPALFNGQTKDAHIEVSAEEMAMTDSLIRLLWQIVHNPSTSMETKLSMVTVITHYYNDLFSHQPSASVATNSNAQDIFDRFIYLVNNHCKQERKMAFYASKMCLTERYLGTLIRQASGVTAKEWIDRAVITTAKVMLKHSNLQISQISDELRFANISFFCKYFKRLTGESPQEYRSK
jgi:AraC family transcriptional activator of pobA